MSILWSGLTEAGAIVPVQVDDTGRVVAITKDDAPHYWEKEGGILKPSDGESISIDGTISSSVGFAGPKASFTQDVVVNSLVVGRGAGDIDSNTALGQDALLVNTTGSSNTAVGQRALYNNTDGNNNTAIGQGALYKNSTGSGNTALGLQALSSNTEGGANTAVGLNALFSNTTGSSNAAFGLQALLNNSTGGNNTAIGRNALFSNTTGSSNTALGQNALQLNTEGNSNTAVGLGALLNNTTGSSNTALGQNALQRNTEGGSNTAVGLNALYYNTTGSNNTFIGRNPGIEGLNDTVCISAGTQERIWIDSDGQAGIGTNNPQAKLDVAGPALFANGLCGFLSTGEIFFQSRNDTYKLVVASNGLVSAEPIPTSLLGLNDREQLVIPPAPETKDEELLPITVMDNDNA